MACGQESTTLSSGSTSTTSPQDMTWYHAAVLWRVCLNVSRHHLSVGHMTSGRVLYLVRQAAQAKQSEKQDTQLATSARGC